MKILIVTSSGRKNGNTDKIANLLIKRFKTLTSNYPEKIQIEKIYLSDYELRHCLGCRNCMDRGEDKCPLKDDLTEIKKKIDESNAVIFGSPVYVGDVNSMMKTLIDRLAYICHRQEFYEKTAFIYSTAHSSGNKHTNRSIAGALISWGFQILGSNSFRIDSYETENEVDKRYQKILNKMADKVYYSITKEQYLKPSAISLAMFKLQQKHRANPEIAHPLDYNYWKEKGWVDKKTDYYFTHETGFLKKVFSRIIYSTISLLFVH